MQGYVPQIGDKLVIDLRALYENKYGAPRQEKIPLDVDGTYLEISPYFRIDLDAVSLHAPSSYDWDMLDFSVRNEGSVDPLFDESEILIDDVDEQSQTAHIKYPYDDNGDCGNWQMSFDDLGYCILPDTLEHRLI